MKFLASVYHRITFTPAARFCVSKLKLLVQSYCSRLGLSSVDAAVELLGGGGAGSIPNPCLGARLADGMPR